MSYQSNLSKKQIFSYFNQLVQEIELVGWSFYLTPELKYEGDIVNGLCLPFIREIHVREELSEVEKLTTITHEVIHLMQYEYGAFPAFLVRDICIMHKVPEPKYELLQSDWGDKYSDREVCAVAFQAYPLYALSCLKALREQGKYLHIGMKLDEPVHLTSTSIRRLSWLPDISYRASMFSRWLGFGASIICLILSSSTYLSPYETYSPPPEMDRDWELYWEEYR
jgi:hypothetical protein